MSRQEEPVSGYEFPIVSLILDPQTGSARDQQHELVAALIEPLAFRCNLTRRDNPLDEETRGLDQVSEQFFRLRT
ncbi:MAG: hypothetical protein QNJ62_09950 [Methyloceanibacter sp.]|nr:hypothetical protein [Methyloceanibacter sp.]